MCVCLCNVNVCVLYLWHQCLYLCLVSNLLVVIFSLIVAFMKLSCFSCSSAGCYRTLWSWKSGDSVCVCVCVDVCVYGVYGVFRLVTGEKSLSYFRIFNWLEQTLSFSLIISCSLLLVTDQFLR